MRGTILIVLTTLSLLAFAPQAAASEAAEHAPTCSETAGSASSDMAVAWGPPDPNGCRPYCR